MIRTAPEITQTVVSARAAIMRADSMLLTVTGLTGLCAARDAAAKAAEDTSRLVQLLDDEINRERARYRISTREASHV